MKAAILYKQNEPLIVDQIEIPPLGIGQVLVNVQASSICGRQIGEITGAKGKDKFLPHLLGHEGCGIVEQIGLGVTKVKSGDKVVMHWRKGSGIEAEFPRYKWKNKFVGGGLVTTFNEYSIASENRLTKISSDIPSEIGALMGCAVTTALGLINNEASLKIGQPIAIIGVGGVGLNVVLGAAMVSAFPIIAIDIVKEKLKMAKALGATHTINTTVQNLDEVIQEIMGSNGIDVVVECSGRVELIEKGYSILSSSGKIVMVGQPHHKESLVINNMSNNFIGKIIQDSQGGLTNPDIDINRYLNLYLNGKLDLKKLITNNYQLSDINKAISDMKSGKITGKCIINTI